MENLRIDTQIAAARLSEQNDIHILTHKNPDGDTFGCAFALWHILRAAGKRATVFCSDGFPERYDFLYKGYEPSAKKRGFTVAVDVADTRLLGSLAQEYADGVDLCLDHHITNEMYAHETAVEPNAAAACELIYGLCGEMGVEMNADIARCLYTGIATDSGCFKFSNTTPRTHMIAAELLRYDIGFAEINRRMFDLKSRSRIALETHLMKNIELYTADTIAVSILSQELIVQLGLAESELDGVSSLPLQIEGVKVAVTMREKKDGSFKLSMRSPDCVDVAEICAQFGGGGHVNAAGCEMKGSRDEVCNKIVMAISTAESK